MNSDWYIIINPRAGSGKTMQEWLPAEKVLEKFKITYTEAFTHYRQHAVVLAKEAASNGFRKIMAVGGDGTLHEVFQGIMQYCDETSTPPEEFYMCVAPIGSGNDWIKGLHIDKDPIEVLKLISKHSYGTMDVIKVESVGMVNYMANVGGTGFDSRVCERANKLKSHGWRNKLLYLRALRHTILNARAVRLKVICDGTTVFEDSAYSLAMGNGRYSGGGMRQVPEARMNDGFLDAMVVPKVSIKTLLSNVPRLYNGTLMSTGEGLVFARGKKLEIIPLDDKSIEPVEVDGEIKGTLPATITVTGHKINVVKALGRII